MKASGRLERVQKPDPNQAPGSARGIRAGNTVRTDRLRIVPEGEVLGEGPDLALLIGGAAAVLDAIQEVVG